MWRQSSIASPQLLAVDPENRWFGRADRRRLDAEVIRDSMLPPPASSTNACSVLIIHRRSMRITVSLRVRGGEASTFRSFATRCRKRWPFSDLSRGPSADQARNRSTVSTQALFMNHPFTTWRSRRAADQHPTNRENVVWLYRTLLGRSPTSEEADRRTRGFARQLRCLGAARPRTLCSADFRFCE